MSKIDNIIPVSTALEDCQPPDSKKPRLSGGLLGVLERRLEILENQHLRTQRWISKHHLYFNGYSLTDALAVQQPSDLRILIKELSWAKWGLVLPIEDISKYFCHFM